jgi:hypothetical protein
MDSLSELITDYARSLQLEGSEYFARLDQMNSQSLTSAPEAVSPCRAWAAQRIGLGTTWRLISRCTIGS